jgi:hypothetical protein
MMSRQGVLKRAWRSLAPVLLCTLTAVVSADDKQPVTEPQASFVYKPPLRGTPGARVGGGTRGTGVDDATLLVLAPDHVGLTTQAQPTLYWYSDIPVNAHFEFALIDNNEIDPLLEIEVSDKPLSGIKHLDIGDYDITLQPGVSYQWTVALVVDENNRSTDVFSTGVIERIETDEALKKRIEGSKDRNRVAVYASEGIWYDALDAISSLIEQAPADQDLLSIRASLLEQAGLSAATAK